jgi:predicted transcriptional regulator
MVKKRNKLEIVFEIIDILSKETLNPTKLAMLVNMPYDRLKKLLEELIEKGIIQFEEQGRSKVFMLTPQGYKLYEELKKVRKILKDYGILD